ncbi:MAG: hypothetical protein RR712_03850 [Terrisporobacter sp.]
MKKSVKIGAGVTAFLLIAIILYFANGLVGNPVSKMIANKNGKEYISKEYRDMNLQTGAVYYSFKDGRYHIDVKSSTSKDTYFEIAISPFGKVEYDSYEDNVTNKWNTYERINSAYFNKTKKLFESKDFPYKNEIGFGDIKRSDDIEESEFEDIFSYPKYGIDVNKLELDKSYNIYELGKEAGCITLNVENEEVSVKIASEILLDVKNILDENSISFYAIDFTLEKPRDSEGMPNKDDTSIIIQQFLYKDIYINDLDKRMKIAHEKLKEYYNKLDSLPYNGKGEPIEE